MDMQGYCFWPQRAQVVARLLAALALVGLAGPVLAQDYELVPAVPTGATPLPTGSLPPTVATGQQYVVVVNGSSDQLLNQVRFIEPTAFRTTFQGRSVIQAGRFSLEGNAQQRMTDLAAQGVPAEMTTAAVAQPNYSYSQTPTNVYASTGELPPLPSVATPPPTTATLPALPPPGQQPAPASHVEFGQQLTYAPPASSATYPVNMSPPSTTAAVPAAANTSAPYYVVIPTSQANLPQLSAQVVQLGTPADRVQQRTSPLGPHVAVGPFADRSLANRWSNFYHDAGLNNSRVYFQP